MQRDLHGDVVELAAWRIPTKMQLVAASSGLLSRIVGRPFYDEAYLGSAPSVEVDCVPGAMLMVDTGHFEAAGGYDEDIFLYCEETVLGIRMKRAGFKTLLITGETYQHLHKQDESGASDSRRQLRGRIFASRKLITGKYYGAGAATHLFQTAAYALSGFEDACVHRLRNAADSIKGR